MALPYAVALRPRGRRHSVEQRSRPAVAFLSGYAAWVCLATCYPLSESNKTLPRVRTKVTWHCRSVLHPYISDPQTSNHIRIVAENQAEPRGWEEKAGRQMSTHWKEKCEFGAFESGGNTQNVLKFPSRKMAKAFHTIANGFETIGIEICIGGPASSGEPKHKKHMLVTNLPNRLMFLFFWSALALGHPGHPSKNHLTNDHMSLHTLFVSPLILFQATLQRLGWNRVATCRGFQRIPEARHIGQWHAAQILHQAWKRESFHRLRPRSSAPQQKAKHYILKAPFQCGVCLTAHVV